MNTWAHMHCFFHPTLSSTVLQPSHTPRTSSYTEQAFTMTRTLLHNLHVCRVAVRVVMVAIAFPDGVVHDPLHAFIAKYKHLRGLVRCSESPKHKMAAGERAAQNGKSALNVKSPQERKRSLYNLRLDQQSSFGSASTSSATLFAKASPLSLAFSARSRAFSFVSCRICSFMNTSAIVNFNERSMSCTPG